MDSIAPNEHRPDEETIRRARGNATSRDSQPLSATGWARWIPALAWLRAYDRTWLRGDVVAGLTAAAVVVPQAMAYGAIAGLPLVVGLYTALVPLVVYAVMGSSRPLSVTTTSTIAILTAGALYQTAPNGSGAELVSVAATLAVLVGVMLLLASLFRLGMVATLISEPVLVGFKAGLGLVIVVDQAPRLLGVHFAKGHFLHNLISIADHLPQLSVPTASSPRRCLLCSWACSNFSLECRRR